MPFCGAAVTFSYWSMPLFFLFIAARAELLRQYALSGQYISCRQYAIALAPPFKNTRHVIFPAVNSSKLLL